MFRDLKEYQNLQKLYEEKVSKPENLVEKGNVPGSGVKSNTEIKVNNNNSSSSNNNNKPIVTPFKDTSMGKSKVNVDVKSGPDLNAISKYTNNNRKEVTMSDFKSTPPPEKKVNVEVKDKIEVKDKVEKKPLTTREKFNKKFIKKDKGVGFVRRGSVTARRAENLEKNRLRAQAMAKARIEAKKKADAEAEAKSKENIKSSYEYDAYDLVLEYLLSSEQAATIEEANYVMMQLDEENIQEIVRTIMKTPLVKLVPAAIGTGIATKMIASKLGQSSVKPVTPPTVTTPSDDIQVGSGVEQRKKGESLMDYYKRRKNNLETQDKKLGAGEY